MAWYNPTDPTQRNWLLFGLIVIALVIPYRMYILSDMQAENDAVRTRVSSLEEQNRRAGVLAVRGGGDLQERMALYERHVAQLEELIPGQEEVPALLDDIGNRARLADVDLISLAPEAPEPQEFYTRRAYALSVVGEYHSVARFLTEVASLSRIVTPVQLDVQLYVQPQQYPDLVSPVLATFRIETYVLPEPGSQPPAAEVGSES